MWPFPSQSLRSIPRASGLPFSGQNIRFFLFPTRIDYCLFFPVAMATTIIYNIFMNSPGRRCCLCNIKLLLPDVTAVSPCWRLIQPLRYPSHYPYAGNLLSTTSGDAQILGKVFMIRKSIDIFLFIWKVLSFLTLGCCEQIIYVHSKTEQVFDYLPRQGGHAVKGHILIYFTHF